LPERLSELRSLKEPVVEPAGGPEQVRAQVPVAVLLAVQVQVPVAVHRLAPQPANRDRADKAASPTPHVDV
jgi:hypothetical protein